MCSEEIDRKIARDCKGKFQIQLKDSNDTTKNMKIITRSLKIHFSFSLTKKNKLCVNVRRRACENFT